MKLKYLSLALISTAAGCTTSVEDPSYYLDAVQRVVEPGSYPAYPFGDMWNGRTFQMSSREISSTIVGPTIIALENGQHFDAAIGLFRGQTTSGLSDPNNIPIGRMAFELNNTPAQVASATINNDALAWLPSGSAIGSDWSYGKADPNLYDSLHSIAFSYVDFNGETYKDTVSVAPAFGTITFPDSIPVSHGCVISYQHPIPNDSIGIYVDMFDTSFFVTRPDTGTIVLTPNQFPHSNYAELAIYFYRWNWSARTTPSGKKIGVYSSMETDGQYIPTTP
jgi:hypothetical protein